MNEIVASGLVVGILAMLFFTPFKMARGISKINGDSGLGDTILCAIPILNLIVASKKYYGKHGLMLISPIVLIVGVIARVFIWYNYYQNVTLGTISIILFWGVILFYLISNCAFCYRVMVDAGCSGIKMWLMIIAYPLGQYYIGTVLTNVIANNMKTKETFAG